jgi:hypothetical protein
MCALQVCRVLLLGIIYHNPPCPSCPLRVVAAVGCLAVKVDLESDIPEEQVLVSAKEGLYTPLL